jgi:hypothetical protein
MDESVKGFGFGIIVMVLALLVFVCGGLVGGCVDSSLVRPSQQGATK